MDKNDSQITLKKLNIELFRTLNDEEKFSLIKLIKFYDDFSYFLILEGQSKDSGNHPESCKRGEHDFTEEVLIKYTDNPYIKRFHITPRQHKAKVKICKRCSHINRTEKY